MKRSDRLTSNLSKLSVPFSLFRSTLMNLKINCFFTIPTFSRCKRNLALVNSLTVPHRFVTVKARCYPDCPRWCHDKYRLRPVVPWRLCAMVLHRTWSIISDLSLDHHNGHKEETNRESGQLQLVIHHLESAVVHYEVIHLVSMQSS